KSGLPLLAAAPRGLLLALLALTGAAWVLTFQQALSMSVPMGIAVRGGAAADSMGGLAMAGMTAGGWSVGGATVFLGIWTVMMAAMMLPAAAPMIVVFTSAQARRQRDAAVPTWVFVAGYVLIWAAAGLLVYALVEFASEAIARFPPGDRAAWMPPALA